VVPLTGYDVFLKYDIETPKLGTGGHSQIFEASNRATKETCAIKCVVCENANDRPRKELAKEIAIMRKFEHENVCRLFETFEDESIYYLVIELCMGGPLFDHLEADIVVEEDQAARLVNDMVSAVTHIHAKDIIHRDLKPENFLLSECSLESKVKLINFQTAESCTKEETLTKPCGTLHYVAPEVLRGRYGRAADMWSLGIVTFLMVYAAYPFDGSSTSGIMKAILTGNPDWTDSCYALSNVAMDFLKQVLTKNPKVRLTAAEALEHNWLTRKDVAPKGSIITARRGQTSMILPRYSVHTSPSLGPSLSGQLSPPKLGENVEMEKQCECGNIFMVDSVFFRSCGTERKKKLSVVSQHLQAGCEELSHDHPRNSGHRPSVLVNANLIQSLKNQTSFLQFNEEDEEGSDTEKQSPREESDLV